MNVSQGKYELNLIDRFENNILRRVEIAGNILGIFFKLGTGRLRAGFGVIQVVSGVATSCFFHLEKVMSDQSQSERLQRYIKRSNSYIVNGFANVARGTVELVPFGGVLCILFIDCLQLRRSYIGERKVAKNQKIEEQEQLVQQHGNYQPQYQPPYHSTASAPPLDTDYYQQQSIYPTMNPPPPYSNYNN